MIARRHLPAFALLAIGALWLLIETGFVPTGLTLALLRWWPLVLVALGLDLIVPAGSRGPLPFALYAVAFVLVVGLFGLAGRERAPVEHYAEALPPEARSLDAYLELGRARATITAAGPGELVAAEFNGLDPGRVSLTGTEELELRVTRGRTGPWLQLGRATWDVALTPQLPTRLTIDGGSGGAAIDLTGFDLSAVDLDGGSGATELRLPGDGRYYQAVVAGGSGALRVSVAPGASLDLTASTRSGGLRLEVGRESDMQLTLRTGSGSVILDLPDDAPIRLEVNDDGSGRLNLPGFLERVSGSGDTGVWHSAALERGGRVVSVQLLDVGSGSVTVR